jgi:hypothetical protein
MKKIDKTKILSTQYKSWEEELENNGQDHPRYNSSRNEHYIDIVMNLLHVQDGLCAYTEMRLCPLELLTENNWHEGRYINRNPEVKGQLDHFDPSLKINKGWMWDNFFFIDTDVNTKVKGKNEVDAIMKPDNPDYSEDQFLNYDIENHIFFADTELDKDTQDRINAMILTLGINFGPVIDLRKEYLRDKFAMKKFGLDYEVTQFPTAFKMCTEQNPENN